MEEIVILDGIRTPFGRFGGKLKDISAVDLGSRVIKELISRNNIEGEQIDEVIMGMVIPAGTGQIPARQAALKAGLPSQTPCLTINKVCSSSLKAVSLASQIIKAEDAEFIISGGMENMSQVPYLAPDARWGYKLWDGKLVDAVVKDGLWCPFGDVHMGTHTDNVAKEYDINREEQDKWAFRSHMLWAEAQDAGRLKDEILPIEIPQRRGPSVIFDFDEHPRRDTTIEKLTKLKPVFGKDGTITAGNAPGINDGAVAMIVSSSKKVKELGIKPIAKIIDYTQVATDPKYFAITPALAIKKLLAKNDMTLKDIDLVEINEAFAAVTLVCIKILEANPDIVNVNGGAVAIGHPIGASGGRVLMTLIYELRRRGLKRGIAAICAGTAQSDAVLVEV
ncbi:unnamed protein product [marine sediment metagenome]|uniref:Thiolase N-terminal domain-containing protein n=1 Tax=marine sediment metagenome TaxID=412755 RepID=X0YSB2_9ZZZZ